LLCFLSGRLNPARKGYFHPGYPDHPTEAEIVTSLRREVPKLVVSLHDHELFLTTAPLYYFLIRDFVQTRFDFQDRVGPYDMLVRRDALDPAAALRVSEAAVPPLDESLLRDLHAPDLWTQVDAAFRIRVGRDPRAAAALAEHAVGSDAPHRLLMLRIVTEFGDERSVPALVAIAKRGLNTDIGQQAATAAFFIVGRSILEDYWFTPNAARVRLDAVRPQLDRETFRAWLRNPRVDGRLRYVAVWAAGVLGDQEAVPYLVKMQANDRDLSTVATLALVKLGRAQECVEELIAGLDLDDTYLPSLLIDLYRRDPDTVRPAIRDGFVGGTAKQREVLAYVTAVLHDPKLTEALTDLREDSSPRVRVAAAWALDSLDGERTETVRSDASGPGPDVAIDTAPYEGTVSK
jgi:HEAT repeat protein